ncbi:unnamed protein product [Triticum turgidum subsp. durum]|uniref:Uncharacterized protein n=1 Tax=Triticum turgidum subsp. durum TaxID=4567 RepID=A0A9R0ZBM6_TRITD|nr:unnamed protein product [Triticum turgidum subsp. durum]
MWVKADLRRRGREGRRRSEGSAVARHSPPSLPHTEACLLTGSCRSSVPREKIPVAPGRDHRRLLKRGRDLWQRRRREVAQGSRALDASARAATKGSIGRGSMGVFSFRVFFCCLWGGEGTKKPVKKNS